MPGYQAPLAQSAEHIHGKDGVAGSIPAGGSTPNQQLRPGLVPGLLRARRAPKRRLPAICQQITNRGRMNTIRGDHLERFAGLFGYAGCALSAPVRCSLFDIDES